MGRGRSPSPIISLAGLLGTVTTSVLTVASISLPACKITNFPEISIYFSREKTVSHPFYNIF